MPFQHECIRVVCDIECQNRAETVFVEDWLAIDIRCPETEAGDQYVMMVLSHISRHELRIFSGNGDAPCKPPWRHSDPYTAR